MTTSNKPIIGITIGDVNGIGPEIILKALSDGRMLDICTPVIYGSSHALTFYKKLLHLPDLALQNIKKIEDLKRNKINVIESQSEEVEIEPGKSTNQAGKLALSSLEMAVNDVLAKKIDLLLTAPLNKSNIGKIKEDFTGHTGFLAGKDGNNALMLLCSDKMKICLVTEHVPLASVKSLLTVELILNKIDVLNKCLIQDFNIQRPKIAVLALNPHAGEEGLIGAEEKNVIIPAINQAKTKETIVFGPYPADGFFGSSEYKNFDAVLAMYHDQALIPFKTLSFEDGVNYTAGLSFVRTSPDHGTAYDIAGQGVASETSFRSALYEACDIFARRSSKVTVIQAESAL